MLSYQGQYELAQSLCSDADATNLTMIQTFVKLANRKLQASLGLYISEEERTFTVYTDAISGTSGGAYYLPENFHTFTEMYVTIGTQQHPVELIQDPDFWREINASTTSSTSAYPQLCFAKNDRLEIWPLPTSSDTNTATLRYDSIEKDLTQADYVAGTITTLTNGASAVTGDLTVWTAAMVGRYFKIDADAQWYKIAGRTADTAITLVREYQGVSIATGTDAYTIGQMAKLPPDTYELPAFYAASKWSLFRKDVQLAREHERAWKEGRKEAKRTWGNLSSSDIIPDTKGVRKGGLVNPNYYPGKIT